MDSPDCRLRCPESVPFLSIPENQGTEPSTLVQCSQCSLVFEDPRPTKAQIQAFYDNAALWFNSKDAEGRSRSYVKEIDFKRPFFEDLARRLERRKASGRLLDVGCGAGILELVLDKSRWDVIGVESSRYIAEFGARELKTHVLPISFEESEFADQSFDVIVMKYVLDHMEEPFTALELARRLLRPNGLLVIADLINIESFCARVFAEGHRLIHPMHFTYFSPKTIRHHLQRSGFTVTEIEYPFFKTPYFTLSNTRTLVERLFRRGWNLLRGRGHEKVFSPPFWGSMMDVWAVPA